MRNSQARHLALGLAALILAALPARGQEPQATLQLQTANGQTSFHIGERIPLKLIFYSPNDTQYVVAPWSNARGTEFDFESFDVSPSTGWSDPLATYFAQELIRTGHGWTWPPLLKSKPVAISIDLNQWIRFDQPGVYRVKVISHRVADVMVNGRGNQVALQSNVMEFEIVPATSEWQDATMKAVVARLDRANPGFEDATSDLRYLATPAAIREMTSMLRQGPAYAETESSMGLVGLSDSMREVAIASMNDRIGEPGFPISPLFFTTMSFLYVSPGSTTENIDQQLTSAEAALWRTVLASVPNKQLSARAETVQTLLAFGRNIATPANTSRIASLLSTSFLDLENRSQIDDLRQHWDLLRSTSIVPTLKTLARLPSENDEALGPYSSENLKSAAFKRWYELDPAGARSEILAQIGVETPPLSAPALAFLPSEPLPQFESLWAEAFVRATDQHLENVLGSLLVHFGTGAATPQMIAKLNETPNASSCMSHTLALAYLVRFSTDEARPLLKRELAHPEPQCSHSLFGRISEYTSGLVLNDAAIETLNDADGDVVLDALQYLTAYGRRVDQKPIWQRYVRWSEEWSGKANALEHPGLHPCSEACVGEALARAMIANQGWLADRALISSVLGKCIGEQMCNTMKSLAGSSTQPYRIFLPDTTDPLGIGINQSFYVAQYSPKSLDLLESKIRQYPRGTKFELRSVRPPTGDQRKLEKEVRAMFKKNGMSLERSTN